MVSATLIYFQTENYFGVLETKSILPNNNLELLLDERLKDKNPEMAVEKSLRKIIPISNSKDLLSLPLESTFSLNILDDQGSKTILIKVAERNEYASFTQIIGEAVDGSTVLMTLTETLTNILLKTPYNIYEYVGDDFSGLVNQAKPLGLKDDIHEFDQLAVPLKNNFTRKELKKDN